MMTEEGTVEREKEEVTVSPDNPQRTSDTGDHEAKKRKKLQLYNKNEGGRQARESIHLQPTLIEKSKEFSLKNLNEDQMRELNQMLEQLIEVPKAHSLPRKKYIRSPSASMTPEQDEEFRFLVAEFYKGNRYTYETEDYEKWKVQLQEFLFYRRKFEQSQRVT